MKKKMESEMGTGIIQGVRKDWNGINTMLVDSMSNFGIGYCTEAFDMMLVFSKASLKYTQSFYV